MSNITAYFCDQNAYNSQSPVPFDSNFTSEEASRTGKEESSCHARWSNIQSQQSSLRISDANDSKFSSEKPTTGKVENEIHYWTQPTLLTRNASLSSGQSLLNPWSTNPPIESNRFPALDDLTVSPKEAFLDYDDVSNRLEEEAIRRASLSNASGITNPTKTEYPVSTHGTLYLPEINLRPSPIPSSKNCSMEGSSKLQRKGSIMTHSKQTSIETAASFDLPPHCVPKNAIRWMPASSSSRPSLIGCNEGRNEAEITKSTEHQDQCVTTIGIKSTTMGETCLLTEPAELQCETSQKDPSTVYAMPNLPNLLTTCSDEFSSTSEEDLTRPPSPNLQSMDEGSIKFDVNDYPSLRDPHPDNPQDSDTQSRSFPVPPLESMDHDRGLIISELLLTGELKESVTVGQDSSNRPDTNPKASVILEGSNGQKSGYEENDSDHTLPAQTTVQSNHLESMKSYSGISSPSSDNTQHKNADKKESKHDQNLLNEFRKGKSSTISSSSTTSRKRKGPARSARKISLRERNNLKEEYSDSWSNHEYDDATSKSSKDSRRVNSQSFVTNEHEEIDDSSSIEDQAVNKNPKRKNSDFREESDYISSRRGMSSSKHKELAGSRKAGKPSAVRPVTRNRRPSTSSAPTRSAKGQPTYKLDQPQSIGIRCEHIDEASGITCNTVFRRPYDLARHKETIHDLEGSGSGRKPQWICKECEGCFSRKDALIRHCRIRNHQS